jgi:chromosome segregation ATPase
MNPLIERLNSLEKRLSQVVKYYRRAKQERDEFQSEIEELTALLREQEQTLSELAQFKEKESKIKESITKFEKEREIIKSTIKTVLVEISKLEKRQGI